MTATDIVWAIAWFLVGLVVFQVRGIKSFFAAVSGLFSALSFVMLLFRPEPLDEVFVSIGLGYITGIFTLFVYLIGANISRCVQFGRMSPRIVLYAFSLPLLWIILQAGLKL